MKTPEDEEFERIERESHFIRTRQEYVRSMSQPQESKVKKPWVNLTDSEFEQMCVESGFTTSTWHMFGDHVETLANLIQAKLKEKNNV